MLKRIALTGLFVVSAALGMAGTVAAKTEAGKAAKVKVDVAPKAPQGFCPGRC